MSPARHGRVRRPASPGCRRRGDLREWFPSMIEERGSASPLAGTVNGFGATNRVAGAPSERANCLRTFGHGLHSGPIIS